MFKLAKRALEGAVFLFAAYAFATVPLGKRTGLQHLIAILNTKEAAEAGNELKQAGGRMVNELLQPHLAGEPQVPRLKPPQSKLALSEFDAGMGGSTDESNEGSGSSQPRSP